MLIERLEFSSQVSDRELGIRIRDAWPPITDRARTGTRGRVRPPAPPRPTRFLSVRFASWQADPSSMVPSSSRAVWLPSRACGSRRRAAAPRAERNRLGRALRFLRQHRRGRERSGDPAAQLVRVVHHVFGQHDLVAVDPAVAHRVEMRRAIKRECPRPIDVVKPDDRRPSEQAGEHVAVHLGRDTPEHQHRLDPPIVRQRRLLDESRRGCGSTPIDAPPSVQRPPSRRPSPEPWPSPGP